MGSETWDAMCQGLTVIFFSAVLVQGRQLHSAELFNHVSEQSVIARCSRKCVKVGIQGAAKDCFALFCYYRPRTVPLLESSAAIMRQCLRLKDVESVRNQRTVLFATELLLCMPFRFLFALVEWMQGITVYLNLDLVCHQPFCNRA